MFRRVVMTFCVVAMLASAAGFAATTGRLAGTVKDNEGLALPGVTVQISSDRLIGGPQLAITDVNGGFAFNLLPVGLYTVTANLPGFKPATGQVRVNLDSTASVEFAMTPEQFVGEVVVESTVPVVDTQQVNSQQVFDQDYLQNAAVGASGRDYLSVLSQAAGVAGSGNASVYGGSRSDNSYLIDGMNTTDPATGTFGTNFNYDAIQEVSFQTGGFEAEFGQATGGIINLVTKSGGNDFSGSLDVRYRDQSFGENGKHFKRDQQKSSFEDYSATLGGPILRDKLWFFLSGEHVDTKIQPEDAPFERNYKGENYIGKLTWQMLENHRGVFKVSGDPAEIPGVNTSKYVTLDGAGEQDQGGVNSSFELNSVLSDSLLLNFRMAFNRGYIQYFGLNSPDTVSAHRNPNSSIWSGNVPGTSDDNRDRDEYALSLTYFVDSFGGSHEFKVGAEYNSLYYSEVYYYNGGGYFTDQGLKDDPFTDLNGDGYYNDYVTLLEPEEDVKDPIKSRGEINTFYAQDSWRPMSNLTIKPGVRYEDVKLTNNNGEQIADMDKWQPRFGFAWDITGDAKFVFRGSWGRFMDPTALTLPDIASGSALMTHDYNLLEQYCNRIGLCDPANLPSIWDWKPWTNWDGIDYTLIDNRDRISPSEPSRTIDQAGLGNLNAPYADELILAFETQIAPETSFELTYVDKKTQDFFDDTCANNTWMWSDDPRPSIDDPSTWTTNSGCEYYVITNVPTYYRRYKGIIGKFETRGDWWHLLVSLTNSTSRGNTGIDALNYQPPSGDYFPLNFINQDGYLSDHRRNRLKVSGYALLPWDITIGLDGYWSDKGHITPWAYVDDLSAAPAAALDFYGIDQDMLQYMSSGDGILLSGYSMNLAPRGSFETKPTWNVDLQVSKAFQIKDVDVSIVLAIYNAFGRELDSFFNDQALWQDEDLGDPVVVGQNGDGTDAIRYYVPIGKALTYRLPRRYELGFRIEF